MIWLDDLIDLFLRGLEDVFLPGSFPCRPSPDVDEHGEIVGFRNRYFAQGVEGGDVHDLGGVFVFA